MHKALSLSLSLSKFEKNPRGFLRDIENGVSTITIRDGNKNMFTIMKYRKSEQWKTVLDLRNEGGMSGKNFIKSLKKSIDG